MMSKKKSLLLVLTLFISMIIFLPLDAKAAHRVKGDIFIGIDEGVEFKYQVITPATDNTLGTVSIIGIADDSRQLKITDSVVPFSSLYVSKNYSNERFKIVSIAPSAFKSNTNITHVDFESESYITTIPKNCFAGCKSLQTIYLPTIKKIDDSAFEGCSKLRVIFSCYKLKTIGKNAFKNCKKLSNVFIDSKLKSVGKNAFKNTAKWFSVNTKYRKNCVLIRKTRGKRKVRFCAPQKPAEVI